MFLPHQPKNAPLRPPTLDVSRSVRQVTHQSPITTSNVPPCHPLLVPYHSGVIDTNRLLSDLTDSQRDAATHIDGPLLIIAAAGSGKTRVITRRVAFMVGQGILANSILAITITNKAAREIKQRVKGAALDHPIRDFGKLDQRRWPTICTFHSLCLRVLRPLRRGRSACRPTSRSTTRPTRPRSSKKPSKRSKCRAPISPPTSSTARSATPRTSSCPPTNTPAPSATFISGKFARGFTPNTSRFSIRTTTRSISTICSSKPAQAFPAIIRSSCGELQDRFQYLLIDEYQDTNHAQYIIAHALAQRHRNLCVVGDPDQSIYAWRGADIQNILDFEKDYPDAKVVKLEQNYRSSKTILAIASKLIANNTQRRDKGLWTENAAGRKSQAHPQPATSTMKPTSSSTSRLPSGSTKRKKSSGARWRSSIA